jgi:hypothetical protein
MVATFANTTQPSSTEDQMNNDFGMLAVQFRAGPATEPVPVTEPAPTKPAPKPAPSEPVTVPLPAPLPRRATPSPEPSRETPLPAREPAKIPIHEPERRERPLYPSCRPFRG